MAFIKITVICWCFAELAEAGDADEADAEDDGRNSSSPGMNGSC